MDFAAHHPALTHILIQVRLGLEPRPSTPLFVFVGRLEEQKGADVLLAALPELLGPPAIALVAGSCHLHRRAGKGAQTEPVQNFELYFESYLIHTTDLLSAVATTVARPSLLGPNLAASAALKEGDRVVADEKQQQRQKHDAPLLQLAVLGRGQTWIEHALGCIEVAYPSVAVGIPRHDEALAHLMLAAADFLVVPSR